MIDVETERRSLDAAERSLTDEYFALMGGGVSDEEMEEANERICQIRLESKEIARRRRILRRLE